VHRAALNLPSLGLTPIATGRFRNIVMRRRKKRFNAIARLYGSAKQLPQ